jgi:predicted nucleic acid-binding protein
VAAGRPVAVTNTSPVSALVGIEHDHLLASLFAKLIVPLEVWEELRVAPDPAAALAALLYLPNGVFLPSIHPAPESAAALHAGERAAIALALAHPGAWVLLDDGAARKVARKLGLHVVGTLGVLVEAKRQGLVAEVRPIVERLTEQGIRVNRKLGPRAAPVRHAVA